MLNFFKKFLPSNNNYNDYKVGDFVITKTYQKKGETKGGLIFRIESHSGEDYLASKGSFGLVDDKVQWIPTKKSKLVALLSKNIEKKLSMIEVEQMLPEIIERVKN